MVTKQSAVLTQSAKVLGGVICVLTLTSCAAFHHRPAAADSRLQVVAAENFWGNIAAQIGQSHVSVTSIITDPNADPHLYESDAHDAAVLESARLIILNGLGYDDFMNKMLAVSPNSSRTVLTASSVLKMTGDDVNPHLWYSMPKVKIVAAAMEKQMESDDPAHGKRYRQNLSRFDASLQPILDVEAAIKKKYASTPVAYTERVPGYLLENAGLAVKTPRGFASAIEDGSTPSPADTLAMDNLIANHQVRVLLYNSQATSSVTEHVRDLAKQSGVPVIGVSETLPAGKSFQSWQLNQDRSLLAALGN